MSAAQEVGERPRIGVGPRSQRGRLALAVAGAVAVAGLLAGCGSSAARALPTYGPSWGRFSVSFASKPKVGIVEPMVAHLPAGSAAIGYVSGGSASVFASNPVMPAPPAYMVIVVRVPSASLAATISSAVFNELGAAARPPKTLHGVHGVVAREVIGTERSLKVLTGSQFSDPHAVEGALIARSGNHLYWVITIVTSKRAAKSFLSTFTPR